MNWLFEFNWFEIVENEWREQYDREWGLWLVVVAQMDWCWVAKIISDDEWNFVVPEVVYRKNSRLKHTKLDLTNLWIEFEKSE